MNLHDDDDDDDGDDDVQNQNNDHVENSVVEICYVACFLT